MKHVFIVNPAAGKKNRSAETQKKIVELLQPNEYVIYETKAPLDAVCFTEKYIEEHPDEKIRFYACGGDGTLNEVINGAGKAIEQNNHSIEFACYPIGSANDFHKTFPDYDFTDMEKLIHGKTIETDLLKINGQYTLNIYNMGIDADVVFHQRHLKRFPLVSGGASYVLGLLIALIGRPVHKVKVTLDGELFYEGKTIIVAMANGICYGGGFYCAPLAVCDDGLLDVCIIKKISRFRFIRLVGLYKKGKHVNNPKTARHVIYGKGKKISISFEKPVHYSADGEVGSVQRIEGEMLQRKIKYVLPERKQLTK